MKLKTAQIDELYRITREDEKVSRASTRAKAVERLRKALAEAFNDDDAWFNSLGQVDQHDEEAFEAVRLDLADELGKDKPVPLPKADESERKPTAEEGSSPKGETTASVAPTKKARGQFAGKSLFPLRPNPDGNGYYNPRRYGSHGHRSLQVIIDQPGISYADFLKAGGRQVDLAWDVKHGNATVHAPSDANEVE